VKACHVVPSLEARHGGPSRSVAGLCGAMADAGLDVELLATEPGPGWMDVDGRLRVQVFHRDRPRSLCPSAGLRKHLQAVAADVVHHHSIWLRTLHYAHRTARRLRVPFVISPRGMMDAWAWRHHARRKAVARALLHPGAFEAADGWHATSEEEAASIRGLGFRQPVCVAPNGVSAVAPEAQAAAAAHWRSVLALPPGRPVALFYARFHRKKRLIELVDAWLEHGPRDWLLLVVGIPEDYTPRTIDDYVLRAGRAGQVRAFDGTHHPPPYAIASLFLLPSHGENFGLSIAEALANGVPALVTDSTPWAGLNESGAGWCVPWADFPATIRQATSESAEALGRRGAIAREWVLRSFSWDRSARLLADFYARLPHPP